MPAIFRLYPEKWNDKYYFYVRVYLFDTRKLMQRHINKQGFGPANDCHGQVSGHAHYKNNRMTGYFATMWLNIQDLNNNGAEIVSHECVHAAMRHIHNKRVDLSNMNGEEALAYCVGSMTAQCNNKLHKLGVFK